MKLLVLSTFLLLSLVSISQTRDEIISRHENGMKKIVITYSGIGNTEKIIKISEFQDAFLTPYTVETYGTKIDSESGISHWLRVKIEYFKNGGAPEDQVINY